MSSGIDPTSDIEAELGAIKIVATALASLTSEAQDRVIDYALRMLGRTTTHAVPSPPVETPARTPETTPGVSVDQQPLARSVNDVRSLKDEKQPRTANEMAAVVAYYLSELAPDDDRRDAVTTEDLEKYFKQAQFPLPTALRNTLTSARAAGYFDKLDRGRYKLNPVGYNLVVHGLPPGGDAPGTPRRRIPARKSAPKTTPRKAAAKKATAKPPPPAKRTPPTKASATKKK